jgi:hypothetical protein
VSEDDGASWRVEQRGDDNSAHVDENAPSTFPWGFRHSETTSACTQWLEPATRGAVLRLVV